MYTNKHTISYKNTKLSIPYLFYLSFAIFFKASPSFCMISSNDQGSNPLATIDEQKVDDGRYEDPTGPGKVRITKNLTQNIIPRKIVENIPNLYHYMNKSLIFTGIKLHVQAEKSCCIINYNFHHKWGTNDPLYCLLREVPNDTKYKWEMDEKLYTSIEIASKFSIKADTLPKSIYNDDHFKNQLENIKEGDLKKTPILQGIINDTKWHDIPVYSKVNNRERSVLYLSTNEFRNKLKYYVDTYPNDYNRLITIIRINAVNEYWIEHLWIVQLSQNVMISVSLQFDTVKNIIKVTGIHLNKEYIAKAHVLIPYHNCHCLDNFVCFYDDLKVGDIDGEKNVQKQLKRDVKRLTPYKVGFYKLKTFIENNLDFLDSLKVKEAKHLLTQYPDESDSTSDQVRSEEEKKREECTTATRQLPTTPVVLMDPSVCMNGYLAVSLQSVPFQQQIVYSQNRITLPRPSVESVSSLSSLPLPPPPPILNSLPFILKDKKKGIYIAKSFTNKYLPRIQYVFKDTKQLFYYLNQTVYIQINDKFAMQYYNSGIVLVNCDLLDRTGFNLYATIILNNSNENKHKFEWEMIELSNQNQIFEKYNIHAINLPKSSRMTQKFQSELFKHINIWNNALVPTLHYKSIKIIKNKSRGASKESKQEIRVTSKELNDCLNQSCKESLPPIPIVKIKENHHWVEAVQICKLKNKGYRLILCVRKRSNNLKVRSSFCHLQIQ